MCFAGRRSDIEEGPIATAHDLSETAGAAAGQRAAPLAIPRVVSWTAVVGVVAGLLLLWLVALPFLVIFLSSVIEEGAGAAAYLDLFASARLTTATVNSVLAASGIAALSVVFGLPLAFGVARTPMRFKGLVQATMILALISPEFLLAMGYILLLGPNAGYANVLARSVLGLPATTGPFDIFSLSGLVFTALPNGVAFVFLALLPAFKRMDPALEEAARLKGATAWGAIRTITLPLARPALLVGALLAFATSLAMYGPPEMLGIPVLTVAIREAMLGLKFGDASAAATVLVVFSILALAIQRLGIRHPERYRTIAGKSFSPREVDLGRGTHALTALGIAYCLVALVLPYGTMLAVGLMKSIGNGFSAGNWTLANFAVVLTDRSIHDAVVLSLSLAAASATAVAVLGIAIAHVVIRSRLPGRVLLDYVSVLPLAIPGTALAFALIVLYLNPPLNALGVYGTPMILLLAYLARFIPLGVRNCQAALLQVAPELEEASRVFGVSELKTLVRITIPLILPAILYTWILVFILAVPELSASIVLRGFNTQTVSTSLLGVWNGNGGLAVACAYGISIFAAVSILFALAAAIGRRSAVGRAFGFG